MSSDSPVILAIDCSDQACSVALGDSQSVIEEFTDEPRQHAKRLLPMYRELLQGSAYKAKDISAIAVASGPGSFTGLRIGFSFAQGLSFALSVPMVQVSSLEALAASNLSLLKNPSIGQVQVCLDARMGELYTAAFKLDKSRHGLVQLNRIAEDRLIASSDFDRSKNHQTSALMGSGFALPQMSDLDAPVIAADACIHASAVHRIGLDLFAEGRVSDPAGAEPAYLRRENAWKTVDQQKSASKTNSRTPS